MLRKIGILGGGQLARMLCLKGAEMGFEMHVLSENSDDPAAHVTGFWSKGALDDIKALKDFLKKVDVVTFESEFLDMDLLLKAQKATKTQIYPQPQAMGLLQDRWTQKTLLEKYKLKTSPFLPVNSHEELQKAFDFLKSQYSLFQGLVVKKRKFGYDGYGTFMVTQLKDLKTLKKEFMNDHHGFIAELKLKFDRELAITVCRNHKGDIRFLPLVESFQKDARCLWVKGPAVHSELYEVKKKIIHFLKNMKYVGVMSFEFFETPEGLFVNEIAPRVHNSAHYSLDALFTDQFSYHIYAIAQQKLPSIEPLSEGFAMYNLLGSTSKKPQLQLNSKVKLHWYGKSKNRKGRKMGHINAVEDSPELAMRLLKRSLKDFKL